MLLMKYTIYTHTTLIPTYSNQLPGYSGSEKSFKYLGTRVIYTRKWTHNEKHVITKKNIYSSNQ